MFTTLLRTEYYILMEHYTFRLMTQQEAEEVAYEWHYRGVYSFYNLENDIEALELFLEPRHRKKQLLYGFLPRTDYRIILL